MCLLTTKHSILRPFVRFQRRIILKKHYSSLYIGRMLTFICQVEIDGFGTELLGLTKVSFSAGQHL